jgi:hypothetical protein
MASVRCHQDCHIGESRKDLNPRRKNSNPAAKAGGLQSPKPPADRLVAMADRRSGRPEAAISADLTNKGRPWILAVTGPAFAGRKIRWKSRTEPDSFAKAGRWYASLS